MNRPLRSPGIDGFTDATSNESCASGPACDTRRTVPRSSAATHKIALMAPPMRERTRKRPLKTLERVLSKAGIGSRVEARSWVHAGRVQVNGKVLRNPDHWVDMQRDRVQFDGKPLVVRERLYLLLYKPTGYLTTYKDPEGRPT